MDRLLLTPIYMEYNNSMRCTNCMGKHTQDTAININLLFHVRFQIDWTLTKKNMKSYLQHGTIRRRANTRTHYNLFIRSQLVSQSVCKSFTQPEVIWCSNFQLSRESWRVCSSFSCFSATVIVVAHLLAVHTSRPDRSDLSTLDSICWKKHFPSSARKTGKLILCGDGIAAACIVLHSNWDSPLKSNLLEHFFFYLSQPSNFMIVIYADKDRWRSFFSRLNTNISASGKAIDTHMVKYLISWLPFFFPTVWNSHSTQCHLFCALFVSLSLPVPLLFVCTTETIIWWLTILL